ncbi:MAG: hypothetical protein IKS23_04085 [Alphaproteobacteria bacterium]|nr:hypothetical protein [Alphaproteobacteria bacterium]
MLKGLWTLLITGVLLNPVVFFGGLAGIAVYVSLDFGKIQILATDYHLYLLFFVLSSLYVYVFRRSYNEEYTKIDYGATFSNMVKYFLLMTFSFFIGILLASYFDFSDLKPRNTMSAYEYNQYSEIFDLKKQVEDLKNNYNNLFNEQK